MKVIIEIFLPAHNGIEGLSSLPTNPDCEKQSGNEIF